MTEQQSTTDFYTFRGFYIPKRMEPTIRKYIKEGIIPGRFLCAIITNDLIKACSYADDENLRNIPAYVSYFYNEAPIKCWGSREIMEKWVKKGINNV